MRIFLDNFHQGGKYTAQIASHQAELKREETFTDQKSLSITYLQIEYLNMDNIPGYGKNNERENIVHIKCTLSGGGNRSAEKYFKKILKDKKKARADDDSDKQWTGRTTPKCFRCGSVDHLTSKCPKPPRDNENGRSKYVSMKVVLMHRKKKVRTVIMVMTKNIYAFMAQIYANDEILRR